MIKSLNVNPNLIWNIVHNTLTRTINTITNRTNWNVLCWSQLSCNFRKPKLKSAMQFLACIWFREPEVLFYRGKHWCGWGISLHIHTSSVRSHFVKSTSTLLCRFQSSLLLVPLDSSCISMHLTRRHRTDVEGVNVHFHAHIRCSNTRFQMTKVYILFVNTFLLMSYRPKGISVFSPCIQ